jgi:NAD(P)-dependent dehydrogenase (short-subunit alcohol dehydrogenase family)
MDYYKNKVAIVTGGASGLGLALCEELAMCSATVVPVDVNQEGAQEIAERIKKGGGEALFGFLDVTLYENAQRIVKDVVQKYGRLDLIFNNAGTTIQGEMRDLTIEQWHRVIDVNLWGVIYGAIAAYGVMEKQGHGQIVNIGSLAGLIPVPKEIPYCTSKWALVGFSNALRVEAEDLGIKVNLICPGVMRTPLHDTTQLINVDMRKYHRPKAMKFFFNPQKAARIILRKVEKNRAIAVFPFYAHIVWLLYRLHPAIFNFLLRKMIRDFRKIRAT